MDKWKIADKLIEQMNLYEKLQFAVGSGFMGMPECKRLGIDGGDSADGPLGLRIEKEYEKNCTAFPCGGAVASTWNKELVEKMGECIANDCIHHNKLMILGPGINLKRTPLCGRNFEYYSEDPVLAGKIAAAYVRGVERQGVAACVKHLVANNQELYRSTASVEIDERTLHDIYLKPFRITVEESNPTSMMMAYNRVNGIFNIESNYLMKQIVRNMWGYNGILLSDWYATKNPIVSIKNGLNLQMPWQKENYDKLVKAYEVGEITEEQINDAIRPTVAFLASRKKKKIKYDRNIQHEVAKQVATEGIVLLKNDNNILPITPQKYKKVAVVGGYAKEPVYYGYGSARVYTRKDYVDVPIDEIKKTLGTDVQVSYVEGYSSSINSSDSIFDWRPDYAVGHGGEEIKNADIVLMFLGLPFGTETEETDLESSYMFHYYYAYIQRLMNLNKNIVIIMQSGIAITPLSWNDRVPAIVQMWMAGESGGGAIADVLCGKVSPSGKLSETMIKSPRKDLDYPGDGLTIRYNEKFAIGYRYYDDHKDEVAYPFGHGLSYTKFDYSDFKVEYIDENLKFTFTITNCGETAGKETAQIYFSKPDSFVARPKKELLEFVKTKLLSSGESQSFDLNIPIKNLSYFNIGLHKDTIEAGVYLFALAASSTDIRLTTNLNYIDSEGFSMTNESFTALG